MKLSTAQRETLRKMFGDKCAYCGHDLPERGWHADHIEPVYREWWKRGTKTVFEMIDGKIVSREVKQVAGMLHPQNDHIDNLFPSCRACNIDKGAYSLEVWRKSLEERVNVCRRNHSAFRHAERFGRVQVVSEPLVFWFEKYRAKVAT